MTLDTPHRPLRTLFALTSMPVGGAETLLVNLVRRLDRKRFLPELACLKQLDVLGERMARELPVSSQFLQGKYDLRVLPRLIRYLRQRQIDAVITVGAGDKMFWGRLAAFMAGTPVIISALHSTGWPDGIGRLNRCLTPLTDAFIGVAEAHGRFLVENEALPRGKVVVIRNGIDMGHFQRDLEVGARVRAELQIPSHAPVCTIVAALRREKNHVLFLETARRILAQLPESRFLVVGDGPERERLTRVAESYGVRDAVRFLGTRNDVARVLAASNVFLLTSLMEANPVSILESLAVEVPVVATNVGSVSEMVIEGQTGYLVESGNADEMAHQVLTLLRTPTLAAYLGNNGRQLVRQRGSLEAMVQGYESLLSRIFLEKTRPNAWSPASRTTFTPDEQHPLHV